MMNARHLKHKQNSPVDRVGTEVSLRTYTFPTHRLPHVIDLSPYMTPVEEQENMLTCCANAFAGVCEYLIRRSSGNPPTGEHIDVSRLFLYYNGQRRSQRTRNVADIGVDQRSIALGLRKHGVCEEELWPYQGHLLNREPSSKAYRAARKYTAVLLRVPIGITEIETCLNNGIPVPIDIILDRQTERNINENGGFLKMHQLDDRRLSLNDLHTVVIVGYNRHTRYFHVRNSYGTDWGYKGYFHIPYDFIHSRRVNHTDDLWTVMQIIPRPAKLPDIRQLSVPHHHHRH